MKDSLELARARLTFPVAAYALFITLVSTVSAYYYAFTRLQPYDDEGTMMWTVKGFFAGQPLYDQVLSIYGPAYYFYELFAHMLMGATLSHHSVRLVSISFWVATALVVFLLVFRVTGSWVVASLGHLLAFRMMEFIGREPAHPQEACVFLLVALGLTCFATNPSWRAPILGALAALTVATKINLGVFVVVALVAGLVYTMRSGPSRRIGSILASAGVIVLPILLMTGRLREGWAAIFCALAVLSSAGVVVTVWRREPDAPEGFGGIVSMGVGFAIALGLVCWFPLAHGSTMPAMIDWLIVKPATTFGRAWYLPTRIPLVALPWAGGALALAYLVRTGRIGETGLAMLKVGFGGIGIVLAAADRYPFYPFLYFAAPLLWLVSARSSPGPAIRDSPARIFLLVLSITQLLYAYPVAGSQVKLTMVLMIAILMICLADGMTWIWRSKYGARWIWMRSRWSARAALWCVALLYLGMALRGQRDYARLEAVGLPGTEGMRLEHGEVATLQGLISAVKDNGCQILVSEPGLFSFNMFTGKPAPAGMYYGAWMAMMTPPEQEKIVNEVAANPAPCVLVRQDIVDMWTRKSDISDQPLTRYIQENFRSVLEINKYSFRVRKN